MFVPVTINRATCVICKGKCPESHTSFKGYSVCSHTCQQTIINRKNKLAELLERTRND